jgi:hypothetical protein
MNIEFSQEDFQKFDSIVAEIPFKYAYPVFLFLQGKVQQAKQKEIESKIKTEDNGNQADG